MIKRTFAALALIAITVLATWAAGPKTITYLSPETDPTSVATDNSIIAAFEKENPGVKVILTHADLEEVLPKLSAMLRAGTAPDVAFLSPRYVAGLVEQGFLVQLDDVYKSLGDIPKNFLTPSIDGKIYDIPAATESKVLYYRKDIFAKSGIAVPKTMEEWMAAAKALTVDTNGDGKIDQYGIGIELSPSNVTGVYLQYLWAFGGEAFDRNNNVTIDSPTAIKALQYLCEMTKYCPPGFANVGMSDLGIMFSKGIVAMTRYPGRLMSTIDRYNADLRPNVDVVPGPSADPKMPMVKATINDFVVFKTSKNTDIAKKFIEFYMSDEQYFKFLTASVPGHSLPVRQGWLNNKSYFQNEAIARWSDIVKKTMDYAYKFGTDYQFRNGGVVNPYFGRAIALPVYSDELSKAITGQVSPEQALKTIAKTWRETFNLK